MALVNDILRANLRGDFASTDIWNMVFHYRVTLGTESDYVVIATAIEAHLSVAFALMEGSISLDVDTQDLDLAEWDFSANEFDGKANVVSSALNGGEAGDPLPNGVSIVMRFITEELRRQARKFVPGITEIDCSANAISGGLLAEAALTSAILNNTFVAGGVTLAPCTFNDTPLSPRFETSSLFIDTSFINSLVGYQRGRQPGAGA